jgi:hypothetical protein
MISQVIQKIRSDKSLRVRLLVVLVSVFFLLVILLSLFKKEYTRYSFLKSDISVNQNFAKLNGGYVYFYNGVGFIKKNIDNGQEEVLSAGKYLPAIKTLDWVGEKGVIVTFGSGFYNTEVEKHIRNNGGRIDSNTKKMTWYIDFSSGTLTLLSEASVVRYLSWYSQLQDKLYFILPQQELVEDSSDSGYQLSSYELGAKSLKVEQDSFQVSGVKEFVECPAAHRDSTSFCLISLNRENPREEVLYSYKDNEGLSEIYKSKNILKKTNSPDYYLTLSTDSSTESQGPGRALEGGALFGNAILVNISVDNIETNLGLDISGAGSAFYIEPSGEFLLLNNFLSRPDTNNDGFFRYVSGKVGSQKVGYKEYSHQSDDGESTQFVRNQGYGNNGHTLMSDFGGNIILVSKEEPGKKYLAKVDISELQPNVDSCVRESSSSGAQFISSSNLFRIFWNEDSDLEQNIRLFSGCLKESQISTFGYNFKYGVTDPSSGRIISE